MWDNLEIDSEGSESLLPWPYWFCVLIRSSIFQIILILIQINHGLILIFLNYWKKKSTCTSQIDLGNAWRT